VTVKLRLMRMGKKKQPTYRIVATDSRSPRDGRFIEIVGTYAPRSEPSVVQVDNSKALRWLENGAQPTDTVRKLLGISGAWAEFESHRSSGGSIATATKAPTKAPAAAKTKAAGVTKASAKADDAAEDADDAGAEDAGAEAPGSDAAEDAGEDAGEAEVES